MDILDGYNLNINWGQQDKHIFGKNNYIDGRSILIENPEKLVKLYAGRGEIASKKRNAELQKERFTHHESIGYYVSQTGKIAPTNKGIIHYSNKGVHIVPARPWSDFDD